MSKESRREYTLRIRERYGAMRTKRARGRILDDFCAECGKAIQIPRPAVLYRCPQGHADLCSCSLWVESARAATETIPEFALQYDATGKYYGIYALTNDAPILSGRGRILIDQPWSFLIRFNDQGVATTYGPFKFKNDEPILLRQHAFHLATRGLYDIQQALAREAASNSVFKVEQQARGLVEHNGGWVSTNVLRVAQERELAIRTNALARQAAIPAASRCRACGGLGLIQQGVETFGDTVVRQFSGCPACQGTGREPTAAAPAPAPTSAPPPPPAAATGSDAPAPATPRLTPIGFKGPGGGGPGGVRRIGQ